MKKIIKSAIALTLCISAIVSCKKQSPVPFTSVPTKETQSSNTSGEIILGAKLKNPYSVKNMEAAYNSLTAGASNQRISAENPVKVTHYYIRFLPKDWKEYDILKSDTALKLFEIPLDYEIKVQGNNYHDPSVSTSLPTWQYTSIEKDYNFDKSIKYEILEELYLPEKDESLKEATSNQRLGTKKSFVDLLVDKSMILTENYNDTLKVIPGSDNPTFDPVGIIQVYDTRLGKLIPLEGVEVRARRWFDYSVSYTDASGFFRCESYKRDVNYALFFERYHFDVRSGSFGQAWINGPKSSNPWILDIWDQENAFYSHIFRAAFDYYYLNDFGVGTPPLNGGLRTALKIGGYNEANEDFNGVAHPWTRPLGVLDVIRIYNPQKPSDEIYSTTVHEIGHAAHWWQNSYAFNNAQEKVVESWARGIQYVFTNREYRALGAGSSYDFNSGWQWLSTTATQSYVDHMRKGYTPIVVDLMDNFNQQYYYGSTYAPDNVSGFTIAEICAALNGAKTLEDWKNNLKNYNRVPVSDLDNLFNFYINI